jgi:hypothetical protein
MQQRLKYMMPKPVAVAGEGRRMFCPKWAQLQALLESSDGPNCNSSTARTRCCMVSEGVITFALSKRTVMQRTELASFTMT